MTGDRTPSPGEVLGDLARVKALFQARTIALAIGAAPPSPELFASETHKDRSGKHGAEVA